MALNIQVHGISCAITVIDYYISYGECQFKMTALVCVTYGILYTIFSVLWSYFTHDPIYPVIDWFNDLDLEQDTGVDAAWLGVACVVVLLIVCVVLSWFVSWSKQRLIDCYHLPEENDESEVEHM